MKTIKFLILAISIIILSSCNDSANATKCLESVQSVYPEATIFAIPDEPFQFIVCDTNGSIYYIETMSNRTTKITSKIKIKQYKHEKNDMWNP